MGKKKQTSSVTYRGGSNVAPNPEPTPTEPTPTPDPTPEPEPATAAAPPVPPLTDPPADPQS